MDLILPKITDDVRPIYLGRAAEIYCVVDIEDYDWAMQWRWKAVKSKGVKEKWYAYRNTRVDGRNVSFYLHKEICFRTHGMPPTDKHVIADHRSGDSLFNRRLNLEWETRSGNRINLDGLFARQLRMTLNDGNTERMRFSTRTLAG